MTKGMEAPGLLERKWAEAMEWMKGVFGGE